jgi:ribosomal protein S7
VYYIHYYIEGLFKSGKLTEAEKIVQQALGIVSGNRTLKNDLLVIQNALNN